MTSMLQLGWCLIPWAFMALGGLAGLLPWISGRPGLVGMALSLLGAFLFGAGALMILGRAAIQGLIELLSTGLSL